jgi:hypothetical protein
VTFAQRQQVKNGMTLPEVEALLGPGQPPLETDSTVYVRPGDVCKRWGDKDNWILVNFRDGKVAGMTAGFKGAEADAAQSVEQANLEARRQADERAGRHKLSINRPPPGAADRLTQIATFGNYQISLPQDFIAEPAKTVGNLQVYCWTVPSAEHKPTTLLIALSTDERLLAEARANMRQALINFSAGATDSRGIRITSRENTQTGSIGGLVFSGFDWFGKATVGTRTGYVYGGLDGNQVVAILGYADAMKPITEIGVLQAIMASFKKR